MFTNEALAKHLTGTPGETLFHQPVHDLLASIEDQFKAEGLRATLNLMGNYGDERSKVLMAALASEAVIDMLIAAVLPGYEKEFLEGNDRDMTFSLKIKLLKALAVVPRHLIEAADLVRAMRNEFAHNLRVDTLADLTDQTKTRGKGSKVIGKLCGYYERQSLEPKDQREERVHVFDAISLIATAGLAGYLPLVRDLNAAMRDPTFEAKLRRRAEKRLNEAAKAVLAHVQAPPPLGSGGQLGGYETGGEAVGLPE